ncbi:MULTISPECIES: RICIN domain-containing protein [unclassified Agarivorans]|uniref:RICIN domain-containing protein n=1 Tax=unclassified Agarivorans TaxID=2636026 RepID=UPI003D7E7B0A
MNRLRTKKIISSLVTGVSLFPLALHIQAAEYCKDQPVDGAIYKIVNVGSELLLAAESDSENANVAIENNAGKNSQRFYLNYQSSTHYWTIQASNTDYAASVKDSSSSNGATVRQETYDFGDNQQWELKQATSGDYIGAYKIVNKKSSLSLSANGTSNGSNVRQENDSNTDTQRWWLEPVTSSCSGSAVTESVVLNGSAGDGIVKLSWNDSNTNSNYQIYQDTDSDPSGRTRIASVSPSTLSYTASGLQNGKTYYFWVKYTNSDGGYSNSSMFSATPKASSSGGSNGDSSSSAAAPTADAAKYAGANSEPRTNGYPSFIKSTVSGATVVSSLSSLLSAIDKASAGDVIYIRSGTYKPSSPIIIDNDGSSSKTIVLSAYPGDNRPVLDFSAMSESGSNRGIEMKADYWHIYGFDIKKAGDNGMHMTGSHNTVEFMAFYENADTGLQIDSNAAYNFIKNSDSYYNADSSLENADGFAAKLGVGTGNYFYGCRAWQNLDDGFDGYLRDNGSSITTTHEYSWMIRNGYQKNGSEGVGDGNGFKTGGSDNKDLAHNGIYINTISADNTADGYDQNSNRGEVTIYNAISYKNARNYGLGDGSSRQLKKLTIKNSISLDGDSSDKLDAASTSISKNGWQNVSTSSSDFVSLNVDDLLADRQDDGSLPVVDFFHLKSDSDLIDAGTNVGLSYNGSAPDIGAFESN